MKSKKRAKKVRFEEKRIFNRKERKVRKEDVGATGWSPFFAARRKKICATRANFQL
jgi:hypothetical protein